MDAMSKHVGEGNAGGDLPSNTISGLKKLVDNVGPEKTRNSGDLERDTFSVDARDTKKRLTRIKDPVATVMTMMGGEELGCES